MKNKLLCLFLLGLFLSVIAYVLRSAYSQADIQSERLKDGVERWYRTSTSADRPWFFQQLQNIFSVIQPSKELPFGRSVAFLVGVSEYQYLTPSLPFVKYDIKDMREFLLTRGGFDEVYIATEKIVNRDLIEHYIINVFFKKLNNRDRFLFYYAGHGDDAGGNTGYMQFYAARPNNFVGSQVLKIKDAETWCSETSIKHLLFIFDCCASGLAFTPRGGDDNVQQLLSTLSGNGSRSIITAGTADEQTFEVPRPGGKGNGVLTRALLDALERGLADKGKDGFITVDEIYAHIKDQVASFSARYQKRLTPRLWTLDPADYRGTFIFINPEAQKQGIVLAADYSNRLKVTPIPRGETVATYGIIHLTAYVSGEVFIDDISFGTIESGEKKEYENIRTGSWKVIIKTPSQIYSQNVTVLKGQVVTLTMRPPRTEPITEPPEPPQQKIINGMTLVLIRGGTFDMGDTFGEGDADEKPVHSVTVSDFYMGKTEVTNAQYAAFLNNYGNDKDDQGNTMIYEHDWGVKKSGNRWQPQSGYENHPVVNVTWYGAAQYAKWAGCRLPTEAQWEYAAREGGKKVRFGNGKNIADPAEINFDGSAAYKKDYSVVGVYRAKTVPVASFRPNALGLYDMSGNVWEWCWDWKDVGYDKQSTFYEKSAGSTNPLNDETGKWGKVGDLTTRILRGGSWYSYVWYCRSSYRGRGSSHRQEQQYRFSCRPGFTALKSIL